MRIRRESMVQKKNAEKKTEKTYLFQGQSEILNYWFDLDIEWVKEHFIKR